MKKVLLVVGDSISNTSPKVVTIDKTEVIVIADVDDDKTSTSESEKEKGEKGKSCKK